MAAQVSEAPLSVDETAPIASLARLYKSIEKWRPQNARLAPHGTNVERLEAVIMACAARTPKILDCSYASLRQAISAAFEMGLELGGYAGEAYLIPYENKKRVKDASGRWVDGPKVVEATFMPGYKGYLRLAQESGLIRRIKARVILLDDVWEDPEDGPDGIRWRHVERTMAEPKYMEIDAIRWKGFGRERQAEEYKAKVVAIRGAYAVAQFVDRSFDDCIKPIALWRIEQIRRHSKAGFDGPWINDYHEMAEKTAMRNLWKWMPKKNDRMRRLEELDQEIELEARPDGTFAAPIAASASQPASPEAPEDAARRKMQRVAASIGRRAEAHAATEPAPPQPAADPAEGCDMNCGDERSEEVTGG